MKTSKLFPVLLCLILLSCKIQKPLPIEEGVSKTLANYRKEHISNVEYQLYFNVPESKAEPIQGKNKITFQLNSTTQNLQIDFKENPQSVKSVSVNGKKSDCEFQSEHIIVHRKQLQIGKNEIEIEFIAGNSSLNRNDEFLYSLFVPDRARTAFPCFDQPDLKATFELTINIPAHWKAIANEAVNSKVENEVRGIYRFDKTKPLPTYLFSFVAGKFESIIRERNGHQYTMYHRETNREKLTHNTDEIFRLLFESLDWLEEYTDIDYPFSKYDFVLIPSFQYGGMEHPGATLYRDSKMLLDENATQNDLLSRANLIAHETAHMWFGDLVTMKWFDQVWLKEVFANFLADKMTNPAFPNINHRLKFQMAHFPSSFSVDRTQGANPINQKLENLKDAGTIYGAIIYHKSPIVMNMLEDLTGEDDLRKALQTYLKNHAYGNANWEDLIEILNANPQFDLQQWNKVWMNKPGRPHISISLKSEDKKITGLKMTQKDAHGNPGNWTQDLNLLLAYEDQTKWIKVNMNEAEIQVERANGVELPNFILPNGKGKAYGFFKLDETGKQYLLKNLDAVEDDQVRGIALINLYENLREDVISGLEFVDAMKKQIPKENNSLILNRMLSYLQVAYRLDLDDKQRKQFGEDLENALWLRLNEEKDQGKKANLYQCFSQIAETSQHLDRLYKAWKSEKNIGGLHLSETRTTQLACHLALKMPEMAEEIIAEQISRIQNPDRKKRMQFIAPALSANPKIRQEFFESLLDQTNRQTEDWVEDALLFLCHPLRGNDVLNYLPQILETLEEVQTTGDIFFPYGWLHSAYAKCQLPEAGAITKKFLEDNLEYPENLRLKILQTADVVLKRTE